MNNVRGVNQFVWTDNSGDPQLVFNISDQNVITAQLYQKNVQNQWTDTGITITEKDITIETENLHALIRGIQQKSFTLSKLNPDQKKAILSSIKDRNITIVRGFNNNCFATIHALV